VPKALKKLITKYKKNHKITLNVNDYQKDYPNINYPPFKYLLILWIILFLGVIFFLNWNFIVTLTIFVLLPLSFFLYYRFRGEEVTDMMLKNNQLTFYLEDEILNEFKIKDITLKHNLTKELNDGKDYLMYLVFDKTYKIRVNPKTCDKIHFIAVIILIHLIKTKQIKEFDIENIDVKASLREIKKSIML